MGSVSSNPIQTDMTATGKAHFEVLDGLRGSAAVLVVLFHIMGIPLGFDDKKNLLHHAYLAVDFFFALSGFVIGYAYDDRWQQMTAMGFMKLRLIRLHPLVVLGALMGFASYLFDPFAAGAQNASWPRLLLALGTSLLLLPSPTLPNRFEDTSSLNGPAWSLLQEYIANIAYALVLRRLRATTLGVIALVSGIVLLVCAIHIGSLDSGWGWNNFWMAPVRLTFPFVTGLLLYRVRRHRSNSKMPKLGYLPLSVVLVVAFALPVFPKLAGIGMNGVYDAACVVILFPLIIVAGAHSEAGSGLIGLCKISGRISYPLYITHFAFMYIYANFVRAASPSPALTRLVALGLVPFVIFVAWMAFKYWDKPIRAYLRGH